MFYLGVNVLLYVSVYTIIECRLFSTETFTPEHFTLGDFPHKQYIKYIYMYNNKSNDF